MTSRSNIPLLVAFVMGALVSGAAIGIGLGGGRSRGTHEAIAHLPVDPLAYVPAGARGIAVADVDRLRRAHVLAEWFAAPAADEPCETRLLRRVRSVAIAVGGGLDQVGVAFAGDLPQADLVACARSRVPPNSVMERGSYRGIELMRLVPRAQNDLLPSSGVSEIVYLPSGIVLAGSFEMVRRMIDRGMSPGGSDVPTAATELRRRLGNGYDATVVLEVPRDTEHADADAMTAMMAHVRGVAVGLRAGDTLDVNALFACDDYDSPREVADAMGRLRDGFAEQLRLPSLAEPLRRARIERRATQVDVSTSVTADELTALSALARTMLTEPIDPPLR
jgi:hypothetical protein